MPPPCNEKKESQFIEERVKEFEDLIRTEKSNFRTGQNDVPQHTDLLIRVVYASHLDFLRQSLELQRQKFVEENNCWCCKENTATICVQCYDHCWDTNGGETCPIKSPSN